MEESPQEKPQEKPQDFYVKNIVNGKNEYIFQSQKILKYIQTHSRNDEFIIITFLGKSQVGKSHLITKLSGVQHKIGNIIEPQTEGATIAYAGTINEIYKRMGLPVPQTESCKCDVFFCDTEGVYSETERGSIALLLMPLLIFSTKIVAVLPSTPDDALTNFLAICKNFIKIADGEREDPFKDKLIVRPIDYPPTVSSNPYKDVQEYTKILKENGDISKKFKEHSINPIYVPGGPWDSEKKCHNQAFIVNFLNVLFSNVNDSIIYSNPTFFIENVEEINNSPLAQNEDIMAMFKEKNIAERVLDFASIKIEADINNYFNDILKNMKINEQEVRQFFEKNVELKLISIVKSNKIKKKFQDIYLQKLNDYFKRKRLELEIRIKKYNEYKEELQKLTSIKKIYIQDLNYLSDFVKERSQTAANYIFHCVNRHFTKIEKYAYIIINEIEAQRINCNNAVMNANIDSEEIRDDIQLDIKSIFDKLKEFEEYVFYRKHGFISRILKGIMDKNLRKKTKKVELCHKVLGMMNVKRKKIVNILVKPREYLTVYSEVLNKIVEQHIWSQLSEEQREKLNEYAEENDIESIADLTNEQIDDLTAQNILPLTLSQH